jgi:hypothetical protein
MMLGQSGIATALGFAFASLISTHSNAQNVQVLAGSADLSAAAEEHYPVAVNVIAPVRGSSMILRAPVSTLGDTPVLAVPFRRVPHEEPDHVIREKMRHNPAVEQPDVIGFRQGMEEPRTVNAAAALATRFNGLDEASAAGCKRSLVPPDPVVAKSDTHVLEATNSALRLFAVDGTVLATKDLNTFFGADCSEGVLFDPHVYFDRSASNRRFYVVAAQGTADPDIELDPLHPGTSRSFPIWLAVSRSPDPANLDPDGWCGYPLVGNYLASFDKSDDPKGIGYRYTEPDYPGLGVGADAIVISSNQYTCDDLDTSPCPPNKARRFTFAIVQVVNKLIAANNASACPHITAYTLQPASDLSDFGAQTIQPVQHYTSPSTGGVYLMNTRSSRASDTYRVWRVHGVKHGPKLQGPADVTGSFIYEEPPPAPQALSNVVLDTSDARLAQAVGIGDEISGVHGTRCNVGSGPDQSCVRYVRISVGTDPHGGLTASLVQETTISGGAGIFDFMPGVAVNAQGQVVVGFHRSSADSWLSSFWRIGKSNPLPVPPFPKGGFFGAAQPLVQGDCPQPQTGNETTNGKPDGTPLSRTGDYFGAQTDPSDFQNFWVAGERARQTPADEACVWRTAIAKVTP